MENKKSKYLCNLCTKDHPTYQCPWLVEAQKLLAQQPPAVLTSPFTHGQNLTQASLSTKGGSQGPPPPVNNPVSMNVYMMKGDAYISTRAHYYNKLGTYEKGKEAKISSLPL